jgi:NEDD8-activating enzyme E1
VQHSWGYVHADHGSCQGTTVEETTSRYCGAWVPACIIEIESDRRQPFKLCTQNIIPAVASTNAIIAAACVNEAIKYLTYCSQNLNSYMMYMGSDGVHSHTFAYEQKEDCPVCTSTVRKVQVSTTMSLNEFIQQHLKDSSLRLSSPSIVSASGKTLYMPKPPALEEATRPNLDKAVSELMSNGEELSVTDPLLESIAVLLSVHFE